MSLLMDALKKAEEEKKQAAKRLQEVEIEARGASGENEIVEDSEQKPEEVNNVSDPYLDTSRFSLEPLSLSERDDEAEEESVDENNNSQVEIPTVDETESFSEGLTLENTVAEDVSPQENFEDTQKEIDLNDTTVIEGLSTENASAPFDDTFHGVVFEEEPETDIYEETLPGVPADQLAKDLGGGQYQPTPVAAKTVFSAGRSSRKNSSFKWGVFIVLAILAIGSFSIFYYFTITPVARNLPSPIIARGIESSGIETPIITPVIEPPQKPEIINETIVEPVIEEHQVELAESTTVLQAKEVDDSQAAVVQSEVQAEQEVPVVETIEPVEPNEVKTNKLVSTGETATDDITETDHADIKETSPVASPEVVTQIDASLINISKSKKMMQENVMINQAFKAYQDGHYDAAKSIYEDVLKSDHDNRDAHLGLGAIAINQQDRKSAYSHYVHLLELNPLDTLAMSSLIGLSNNADPVKDESAIKLLIQRDDSVPYLYFLLGNVYAKQKRWVNAQQAFFDAYRLDTTNPDYVLNLAISLDQMGQAETALDYYKSAIELSQNSTVGFDPVPVNNRILALSKLIKSRL
ncbi:MAG: hypothetical protein HND53_08135 [Proteobacteria bacterium]|nr:hypothetical protein [Pseudomonadota bacterium]